MVYWYNTNINIILTKLLTDQTILGGWRGRGWGMWFKKADPSIGVEVGCWSGAWLGVERVNEFPNCSRILVQHLWKQFWESLKNFLSLISHFASKVWETQQPEFSSIFQVFEFLITVNELCEQNYPADSVEVALVFNSEKAKVMFYICWFVTDEFLILFSQIGCNALIL